MATSVQVNVERSSALDELLALMDKNIATQIASRASLKAASATRTELNRQMARDTDIPIRAFREFRVKRRAANKSQTVWFGANPIKATYVAKQGTDKTPGELEKQLEEPYDWGAKAGKYLFPGAFVRRMKSGHVGIFKSEKRKLIEQYVELPQAFSIAELARDFGRSRLAIELAYELDKAMKGMKGYR